MSWLRIDDQIATHHKIVQAGPAAAWLWICSIAYSQNHLTDGFVSDAVMGQLGMPKQLAKQLSSRLLKHNLWHREKGGFRVHDYLDHNASAADRKAEIFAKQEAGRIGGRRSGQVRRRQALIQSKQNAEADTKQSAEAKVTKQRTPLHSTPLRTSRHAPAARADTDVRTNTAGNGADQPRRVAPDTAGGRAYAPVDPPQSYEEEVMADAREAAADPEAYRRKHGIRS